MTLLRELTVCPRCRGSLIEDREDHEPACLACGWRRVQVWEQEARAADGKSRKRSPSHNGNYL